MRKSSYLVQGVRINVTCENQLDSLISSYFGFLYKGERQSEMEPPEFELYIAVEPFPYIPADLVQVVKTPFVTSYSSGKEIYFISADGSIVCMNPNERNAKGFIKKETLDNPISFFSLLGVSVVEVLKYYNLYFLHSAALYGNGIGYLISGDGGCGKTTTSLSLVWKGFRYISDDSLFIKELDGEIIVCPLYTSFHIDQDIAKRFPDVFGEDVLPIPDGVKLSVDISQIFPGSFISSIRPDVIIFPRISPNAESQLYPISRMEVYRRLIKQTILAADRIISRNQIRVLEKLVKQTVGFELIEGRDIYEEPKKIISLIYQINGQNGNHKKNKI